MSRSRGLHITALAVIGSLASMFIGVAPANADPGPDAEITIENLGWGIIGLDSNKVTDGPNVFPQGVKVCNTSGTAKSNVAVTWVWGTGDSRAISLTSDATRTVDIPATSCTEVWWTVEVARDKRSYFKSRQYTVTAAGKSTPTNRELYVEKILSQNRNGIKSIVRPEVLVVGSTVQFSMTAFTATMGYGQLVSAIVLDSEFFDIKSIKTTYSVPTGRTGTNFYQNACNWVADTSIAPWPAGTYRSCIRPDLIGDGRIGGKVITVTVTAKVIKPGATDLGGLIYDYSGSSYHYNSDFDPIDILPKDRQDEPDPPVALDDSATTDPGVPVDIEIPSNDSDPNGDLDPTTTALTPPPGGTDPLDPQHGKVSIDPLDGSVVYTPNDPNWTGKDRFKYWICDETERCDSAFVDVTVIGKAPPVTPNDSASTPPGTPVDIDVTGNDSDPNDDIDPTTLKKKTDPSHGTITLDPATGKFRYTPDPGFVGTDSFTYELCDTVAPVRCSIGTVTITVSKTTLAATGSDSTFALWVASMLALAGGALLVFRRRSRLTA